MAQVSELLLKVQDAEAKAKIANIDKDVEKLQQRVAKGFTVTTDAKGLDTVVSRFKEVIDGEERLVTLKQKEVEVTKKVTDETGKTKKVKEVEVQHTRTVSTNYAEIARYNKQILADEQKRVKVQQQLSDAQKKFADSLTGIRRKYYLEGRMSAESAANAQDAHNAYIQQYSPKYWQEYWNGISGITERTKIAEKEISIFGELSEDAFEKYSRGAISANSAMESINSGSTISSRDWQQMWNTFHNIGVECGVTANDVSVFGRLSDEAFAQYSSGAMSADSANETLNQSTKQVGNSADKTGKSEQKLAKETENAGKKAEKSGKSFTLLYTIFLRLAHTAISAVTRSFREALTEMKAVDSELVVVRKVSNATAEELSKLKDKAYEVGAAYGIAASDFLNAAAEMTRAGYREQAGDLAELATKLQLVGDVSQDTANQFLIATDKAYKMNGDFQKLSATIDKLNEIDNNYATSIQKVADGIGILAPIASQTHVSFEQMAAALGTITAVTQRSGSESARALRSLFLNIAKDTSTEIEEGVTWTVEEINNLQDALKKYAPEVVKAAEASGELINPMEAIGALAKSFEEGILDEQKLMQIVSGLGGKLRSSQLLALIQNWDMYNDMLKATAKAAGSADREVQNALDAWDKKLNQLKNTFTEFVTSILDTDEIKGFIDAAKFLIQSIDNPEEYSDKFANTLESALHSLVEKLPRFQKVINKLAITIVGTFLSALKEEMPTILKALSEGAREATEELSKHLPDILGDFFVALGEVIGKSIVDSDLAFDITESILLGIIAAFPKAFAGLAEGIANAISDSLDGNVSWENLKDKIWGKLFSPDNKHVKKYLNLLASWGIIEEVKEESLGFAKTVEKAVDDVGDAVEDAGKTAKGVIDGSKDEVDELTKSINSAKDAVDKYKESIKDGDKNDTFKSFADAYKSAVEMYEKGLTGSNAYMSAIDLLFDSGIVKTYEEAGKLLGNEFIRAMFEGGGEDFGANAANYIRSHLSEFEGVAIREAKDGTFSLIVEDMEAFAKSAKISEDAAVALMQALDAYDSTELDGTKKTLDEIEDAPEVIKKKVDVDNDELYETKSLVEELNKSEIRIKVHTSSSGGLHGGSSGNFSNGQSNSVYGSNNYGGSTVHSDSYGGLHGGHQQTFASGTKNASGGLALVNEEGAELIYANGSAWIAGGGKPTITKIPRGAGVFNAKETRSILTRSGIPSYKSGLTLWRERDNYMYEPDQSGTSYTAGGIPVNLHEKYPNENDPIKNIESILEELSKYIDDILKKAKDALDKQLKAIDAQIEALEREHNATEEKNKLEELQLKILEAEKKLAEAKNERTVRYFNKETGQWEWMADQKAVYEAEKALQEAQEAYNKEVAEQEYKAQIQALKDLKDALQNQYNDLADHWEEIVNSLKGQSEAQIDFEKLLKQLGVDDSTGGGIKELINSIKDYENKLTSGTYSVPLDGATTSRLLSSGGFVGSVGTLTQAFGMSTADANARGISQYNSTASSIVGDTIYYIAGVKIGSDMMDKPLSQILSVLPIYAN